MVARMAHFDGTLTWVGHGTFLLETDGQRILIDAFVDSCPTTPDTLKGDGLGPLDLILLTHGHLDHVADVATIQRRTGARVAGMVEMIDYYNRRGILPEDRLVDFSKGGTITSGPVSITMVDARHSSSMADGTYAGEPAGFVIRTGNGFTLYCSGDTTVFGDMSMIGDMGIDLAVLCIGGHYTMGPELAATAVQLLRAPYVVGGHFGTFPPLTGTPQALAEQLHRRSIDATVRVLAPGERLTGADLTKGAS